MCIRQLQEHEQPLRQDNLESAVGSGSWSVHSGSCECLTTNDGPSMRTMDYGNKTHAVNVEFVYSDSLTGDETRTHQYTIMSPNNAAVIEPRVVVPV